LVGTGYLQECPKKIGLGNEIVLGQSKKDQKETFIMANFKASNGRTIYVGRRPD